MAKIKNDALVLTDEERERLRKNLLNPPMNPDRDRYLSEIENIKYEETENGFIAYFDEV